MSDISNRTIVALLAVALVVSVAGTMYSVSELGDMGIVVRTISGLAGNDDGNVTLELQEVVSILVHNSDPGTLTGSVKAGQDKCIFSTGGVAAGGDDFGDSNGGTQFSGNDGANSDCDGNWGSASNRQSVFHLIENNGNVGVNVTVALEAVRAEPSGADLGNNSCMFLTGVSNFSGANAGQNGCLNATTNTATRGDVPVKFEVGSLFAVDANNPDVDGTTTENEVDDSQKHPSTATLHIGDLTNGQDPIVHYLKHGDDYDEVAVGFRYHIPSDALPGKRTAYLRYYAEKDHS